MRTELLGADVPGSLQRALGRLQAGGLVAFPTDTVYGLGALAFDGTAVEGIYAAKGRDTERAIPILLGSARMLPMIAGELDARTRRLAAAFWPGPLTLVVPKNRKVPVAVSGSATVAVRVPAHDTALRLLRLSGPMAVTSANLSGGTASRTADEALSQLNGRVDLILDGGPAPGGLPSTIVDCTGPELLILRQGPVSLEEIRAALE